jgi:propanediol dehydratase large subunit
MTPAKIVEVVSHMNVVEMMMAMQKMRARRTFDRIHRHHFFGAIQVDTVAGDKVVDQVKIAHRFPVQLGSDTREADS